MLTAKDETHYLDTDGKIVSRSDAVPWEGTNTEAAAESQRRAVLYIEYVRNPWPTAVVAERLGEYRR